VRRINILLDLLDFLPPVTRANPYHMLVHRVPRITTSVAMFAVIATRSLKTGVRGFQLCHSMASTACCHSNYFAINFPSIDHQLSKRHVVQKRIRFMSADSSGYYSSFKVAELRELLRGRGLPVSGTKAELVERLASEKEKKSEKPIPEKKLKRNPSNLTFEEEDSGEEEYSWDEEDESEQVVRKPTKKKIDPNVTTELPSTSLRSFKEDFQGTRVFVQGLPKEADWKDLKDHFQIAGNVVFASVSIDSNNGESKECGIVQFETSDMATKAIRVMRDHPMNGKKLYVREDVRESRGGGNRLVNSRIKTRSNNDWLEDEYSENLPSKWRRANYEDDKGDQTSEVPKEDLNEIESIIQMRDMERRKKNFRVSDEMREQLKFQFGVHVDDRLKLWWTSNDGSVPGLVSDIKGEGRWGKQKPWRQIPTTPENDALVKSDLVFRILQQRDKARRLKDFDTADKLLQKAYDAPTGEVGLKIDDESRTWRIWTLKPPPRMDLTPSGYEDMTPAEMCVQIVKDNEPEKACEMESLLRKFPGREWNILKKLKQRYYS